MPRPLRPVENGLVYHVINRGNNRQNVFRKVADFESFLESFLAAKSRAQGVQAI